MAFTKKEKNFILKNYNELPISKIAEILKTTEKKISDFLIDQHLTINLKNKSHLEKKKEVIFGQFEYKTLKKVFNENKFFWISIFILINLLYLRTYGSIILSDEISLYKEFAEGKFSWLSNFYGTAPNHLWALNLFGANPWGNRLVALILHLANIILFFAIFRNFISEKILKIAVVLISVHSLFVEPITWVAANPYVFFGFMYLLIMYSSLLYERTGKFYYLIAYYLFVLNFTLSGGHTNYAPILAIIFNLFILKRSFKKEALLSFWMILVIPVFTIMNRATVEARVASLTTGPFLEKFLQTLPFTTAKSLELVTFPYYLALFHEETLNPLYFAYARILTISFIGLIIYLFFKTEKIYFGLVGIACAFCIYIFSPVQVAWFVAERYLYFPVFIMCVFLALLFNHLNHKIPHLGNILFVSYFTLFLFVTFNRFDSWSSNSKLWEANVIIAPDSYRVRNNLAESYSKEGNFKKAQEQYQEAVRINPNFMEAYFNLANAYIAQSKWSEAETNLKIAILINPSVLEAYLRLGIIKANEKDFSAAYSYIEKAQQIDPKNELVNKFIEELKKYEAKQKN